MRGWIGVAAAAVLAGTFAFAGGAGAPPFPEAAAAPVSPGTSLWVERPAEALAQGFILLAAVLGVLALTGSQGRGREGP